MVVKQGLSKYFGTTLSVFILMGHLFISKDIYAFNHPEIQWKTISTEHFLIHYYNKTEPAIYATWKIAEEAYTVFKKMYQFQNIPKINISLAEYDDFSNGFASSTERAIMIWVPGAHFDLRNTSIWLRNVLTHELAHIMALDKKAGIQFIDWTFAADYTSPNIAIKFGVPVPLTHFFPAWFIEGTAQTRSEDLNSDCWDSRRAMAFRCAVLDNKLLSLEEMGHFTHTGIGNEMVYNQGYLFVKHLEYNFGKESITTLWNENRGRSLRNQSFPILFQKKYNIPLQTVYNHWKDSIRQVMIEQVPKKPTTVKPLWSQGTLNKNPKTSNDTRYWGCLTNHKDDFHRTDLIIIPYNQNTPIIRINHATLNWTFSSNGSTVLYLNSRIPNKHGSYHNDLFTYSIETGKTTRLTNSARLYDVCSTEDSTILRCIQFNENVFRLVEVSLSTSTITVIAEGTPDEPFLSINRFPKHQNKVLVSKIKHGKSSIYMYDIPSRVLSPLANSKFQEENPFCGHNGRVYFNADYDGIFNIYSILPDGTDLQKHTSVIGGAFSPEVNSTGALLFSEFVTNRFRISHAESETGTPFVIPKNNTCEYQPLPKPIGTVKIQPEFYKAAFLRPQWRVTTNLNVNDKDRIIQKKISKGTFGTKPWEFFLDFTSELSMTKSDALNKKTTYFGSALLFNTQWESQSVLKNTLYQKTGEYNYIGNQQKNILPPLQTNKIRKEHQVQQGVPSLLIKDMIPSSTNMLPTHSQRKELKPDNVRIHPFLVPFFGYENKSNKPTIGIEGQAALLMVVPVFILLESYSVWHITRGLTCDVRPSLSLYPLKMFQDVAAGISLSTPVSIIWDHTGYRREDYDYNMIGSSSAGAFTALAITPDIRVKNTMIMADSIVSDTIIQSIPSYSIGLQARHAIPIFAFSSLRLATIYTGEFYSKSLYGSINEHDSLSYNSLITSHSRISLTLPLIRNINRGKPYFDNLYGTFFCQYTFSGSGRFFRDPHRALFSDKDYQSPYATFSPGIGLMVELGFIKNYIFDRKARIETTWNIYKKDISLNLSLWY